MTCVYAAMDHEILVARDGDGGGWETAWYDPAERFECIAGSAERPDRVFAGTAENGLLRGTDGGQTWERPGAFGDRVTAVTVSPNDPDTVWAGTEPSSVFHSDDGGRTWTERGGLDELSSADRWSFPPRPHTHHVRWIAEDPHQAGHLYVAIEAGALVRSPDGGTTWQDHPEGARRDNHTIVTHPDAPGRLYVAAGDGYAESLDRGDTWDYPQSGLEHRYVWSLAVADDDPDRVIVSAALGAFAAHDPEGTAYVYRRTEGEWTVAMAGLPGPEGAARPVLAAHDGWFYAVSNRGLYRSERGEAWQELPVEWPERVTDQLPRGVAVVPS